MLTNIPGLFPLNAVHVSRVFGQQIRRGHDKATLEADMPLLAANDLHTTLGDYWGRQNHNVLACALVGFIGLCASADPAATQTLEFDGWFVDNHPGEFWRTQKPSRGRFLNGSFC